MSLPPLETGHRVRVVQHITTRDGDWSTPVEGRVVWCEAHPTGSWYAHGKDKRLWLRRLRLEKDDGELVDLTLDDCSRATVIEPTSATD